MRGQFVHLQRRKVGAFERLGALLGGLQAQREFDHLAQLDIGLSQELLLCGLAVDSEYEAIA